MRNCELTVTNRLGLHARAAARVVRCAGEFQAQVTITRTDTNMTADAKSILSLLMLAARRGTHLQIVAEGTDEQAAIECIKNLFDDKFGEEPD